MVTITEKKKKRRLLHLEGISGLAAPSTIVNQPLPSLTHLHVSLSCPQLPSPSDSLPLRLHLPPRLPSPSASLPLSFLTPVSFPHSLPTPQLSHPSPLCSPPLFSFIPLPPSLPPFSSPLLAAILVSDSLQCTNVSLSHPGPAHVSLGRNVKVVVYN